MSGVDENNPSDLYPGNYSEIQALLHNCGTVTGVDAAEDALVEAEETDLPELMKQYAKENQMILVASGEADLITDGSCVYRCHNGSPMMARITGSGCMSTVMLGAFLSAENSVESAGMLCVYWHCRRTCRKRNDRTKERDDDISQLVYRCRVFDDTGTVGTWNKCGLVLKVRTQKRI